MDPYRDAHRTCPSCNGELREFRERLVCDRCGGVMLSVEDLSAAIEELTGLYPTVSFRDESPGKRACPRCEATMATMKLTLEIEGAKPVKPNTELDRCAAHGLWFDDVELALVLEPVAGKGFGGGRAHPKSAVDGPSTGDLRPFNFKIGGRGWGL